MRQNVYDRTVKVLRKIGGFLGAVLLMACAVKEVAGPSIFERTSDSPDRQEFYLEVTRREGAVQKVFVMKPAAPAAAVILFMGGDGRANVRSYGARSSNFLIRSQSHFFEENLMVAKWRSRPHEEKMLRNTVSARRLWDGGGVCRLRFQFQGISAPVGL